MQIRFVTRSGTNRVPRHRSTTTSGIPALNTNSWFNEKNGLDKNRIILHQVGGSVGGPIEIPGRVRRPRQGVLLLQLRRVLPADRGDAHADAAQSPTRSRASSRYNVTSAATVRARSTCWTLAARERPDVDDRSDDAARCSRRFARPRGRRARSAYSSIERNEHAAATSTRARARASSTCRRRASTST